MGHDVGGVGDSLTLSLSHTLTHSLSFAHAHLFTHTLTHSSHSFTNTHSLTLSTHQVRAWDTMSVGWAEAVHGAPVHHQPSSSSRILPVLTGLACRQVHVALYHLRVLHARVDAAAAAGSAGEAWLALFCERQVRV